MIWVGLLLGDQMSRDVMFRAGLIILLLIIAIYLLTW
jgi:hypothetical protein